MPELVRIKDKFQVTLPASVRRTIALHTGDYLEVRAVNGEIVLRPAKMAQRQTQPRPSLAAFLNERRHVARSRDDIDHSLSADRDAWK